MPGFGLRAKSLIQYEFCNVVCLFCNLHTGESFQYWPDTHTEHFKVEGWPGEVSEETQGSDWTQAPQGHGFI